MSYSQNSRIGVANPPEKLTINATLGERGIS